MSKAVDKWALGGAEAPPNISELSSSEGVARVKAVAYLRMLTKHCL